MQLAVPYLDVNGTEQRGQHIGMARDLHRNGGFVG